MNKHISEEYALLNARMHRDRRGYGANAHSKVGVIWPLIDRYRVKTILDYGSGKGTLKPALLKGNPRLSVFEYEPCFDDVDERCVCDLVVCFDVLEHVEQDYIDSVLDELFALKGRAVIMIISCRPAKKTLPDGRNAHILVRPPSWWISKLYERFEIIKMTFNPINAELIVEAI